MRIQWIFYLDRSETGTWFRHYFLTSLPNMLSERCVCVCVCVCVFIYIYIYVCVCVYIYIYIYKAGDTETDRDKVYADANWLGQHTNIIKK